MKQYNYYEGYDHDSIVLISYTGVFRYFLKEEIECGTKRPCVRFGLLTLSREIVDGITNPYYNQNCNEVTFYVDDKSSSQIEKFIYVLGH